MRLATLKHGGRDGRLLVVADDHATATAAGVSTLQQALDDWPSCSETLRTEFERLSPDAEGSALDVDALHSPLPRAYQWAEASTYHTHMERIRAARGIRLPPDHGVEPAVYNSGSDAFLAPRDPIPLVDEETGLDLEATIAVVTDDVPMGTSAADAGDHIKLVMLANDLTLRNVLRKEYAKGVGFFQAKPARSFAPFAMSPELLGDAWAGGLLRATVKCWINGEELGTLDSSRDCAFDFHEVIAYMTKTRGLAAGTIVGSGTVSNRDTENGFGCLGEKRALETTASGAAVTPWLKFGDRVQIEAFGADGRSLFGGLDQTVVDATSVQPDGSTG